MRKGKSKRSFSLGLIQAMRARGKPAAVTVEMKNPVLLKLEKLDLEQYASALVDDEGYDSLASLEGLTREQAGEIADAVKMKPGHKKRFIDGVV